MNMDQLRTSVRETANSRLQETRGGLVSAAPEQELGPVRAQQRSVADQRVGVWCFGRGVDVGGVRLDGEIQEDQTPHLHHRHSALRSLSKTYHMDVKTYRFSVSYPLV